MKWPFKWRAESVWQRDPALPETYILTTRNADGTVDLHTDELSAKLVAVRCFLSPFDALIEAARTATPGKSVVVESVVSIDQATFVRWPHVLLIGCVHKAWLARQHRLLLRPGGMPQAQATPIWSSRKLVRFEVAPSMLAKVDAIHQRAGLYAWREAAANVTKWSDAQRREAIDCALRTMPVEPHGGGVADEYALFDPEFGQWHFVPQNLAV